MKMNKKIVFVVISLVVLFLLACSAEMIKSPSPEVKGLLEKEPARSERLTTEVTVVKCYQSGKWLFGLTTDASGLAIGEFVGESGLSVTAYYWTTYDGEDEFLIKDDSTTCHGY